MKASLTACLALALIGAASVQGSVLSEIAARNNFVASAITNGNATQAASVFRPQAILMSPGMKNPLLSQSAIEIFFKTVVGQQVETLSTLQAGVMHASTGPDDGTIAFAWGTYSVGQPVTASGVFVQTWVKPYQGAADSWVINQNFAASGPSSSIEALIRETRKGVYQPPTGPSLRNLGVNPVYGTLEARYQAFAGAWDVQNSTAVAEYYAEGGHVFADNSAPLVGRKAIAGGIQAFFDGGLKKFVSGIYGAGHSTSDPMVFSRIIYLFGWEDGQTGSGYLFHIWQRNAVTQEYEILIEVALPVVMAP